MLMCSTQTAQMTFLSFADESHLAAIQDGTFVETKEKLGSLCTGG